MSRRKQVSGAASCKAWKQSLPWRSPPSPGVGALAVSASLGATGGDDIANGNVERGSPTSPAAWPASMGWSAARQGPHSRMPRPSPNMMIRFMDAATLARYSDQAHAAVRSGNSHRIAGLVALVPEILTATSVDQAGQALSAAAEYQNRRSQPPGQPSHAEGRWWPCRRGPFAIRFAVRGDDAHAKFYSTCPPVLRRISTRTACWTGHGLNVPYQPGSS